MEPLLVMLFRWLHMTAAAILLGGFFFLRFGAGGDVQRLAAFRNTIIAAVTALLAGGLYNFFTKPSFPPGYHMWFGIKVLLALHIIAVGILATRQGIDGARRARYSTGIVYSGLAIFAISSYLRWLSLQGSWMVYP